MDELVRLCGHVKVYDRAEKFIDYDSDRFPIQLYRWMKLSLTDSNMSIFDDRTSYYNSFGFTRTTASKDARERFNKEFSQLWNSTRDMNEKRRSLILESEGIEQVFMPLART